MFVLSSLCYNSWFYSICARFGRLDCGKTAKDEQRTTKTNAEGNGSAKSLYVGFSVVVVVGSF